MTGGRLGADCARLRAMRVVWMIVVVGLVACVSFRGSAARADDPPAQTSPAAESSSDSSVSRSFEVAGAEAKRQSKAVGEAIKSGAKKVGQATREGAHQVADASVKGAKEVKHAAKTVAAKTKAAVKGSPPDDKKPTE
jgi:hypothetical protein